MSLSRDNTILASASHDNTVKFWDVRYLFEEDEEDLVAVEDENEGEIEADAMQEVPVKSSADKASSSAENVDQTMGDEGDDLNDGYVSDLVEESSDDEMEDDGDLPSRCRPFGKKKDFLLIYDLF
eukprot:TRINITY_DN10929_c0_g1_i1.p2 TRINITY_DN10929_c0_g1~~TRINITY_DN10929_c0_g1_i1.p2  ORF type:complete len:125 (-),score=42.19 TRINITY_DN10929_c0_g1_i1:110-484(-)